MAMRSKSVILVCFLLIASVANAADIQIDGSTTTQNARGKRNFVFTTSSVGYVFFMDTGLPFVYRKTTDGGATWAAAVTINSATTHVAFDIWYDQWTPGDTGTLIHTWYFNTTTSDILWRTLDTASDTLGTERTCLNGASAVAGRGSFCSGTKTRSGYLYVIADIDAGAEKGLLRSTDSGTTWNSLSCSTCLEATIDEALLFPATGTGDNNDCWFIYQDASADSLTMKMWDSSAAAEVESASMQTMVENVTDITGQGGFTGSVRKSDGHIIVVSVSQYDNAASDMQVWDVSAVNAGSLTGITAKTDITTNIDDNYYPAVYINSSDKIYVAYNGKRDGSETLGTTTKVYYTTSTDGGTTWSSGDAAYMEDAADVISQVWTPLSGPRFFVVWRLSSVLMGNANNSAIGTTPNGFFQLFTPP